METSPLTAIFGWISIATFLIVFLFSYTILVKNHKSSKMKLKEYAIKNGFIAQGVACKTKHRGESTDARNNRGKPAMQELITVDYRYIVDGDEYHVKEGFQEAGFSNIRYPEEIEVYYDPKNPKNCTTSAENAETNSKVRGCYISIGLSILASFLVGRLLNVLFLQ